MYWFKLLITLIIPPLGVFLTVGLRGAFWLNILLTFTAKARMKKGAVVSIGIPGNPTLLLN